MYNIWNDRSKHIKLHWSTCKHKPDNFILPDKQQLHQLIAQHLHNTKHMQPGTSYTDTSIT